MRVRVVPATSPAFPRALPGLLLVVLAAGAIRLADPAWSDEPKLRGFDELVPEAQEAVESGLRWLADHQEPDGSWKNDIGYKLNLSYQVKQHDHSHVGVTSLAGLAFMAGGSLPGRGPYGAAVAKGLRYVLSRVDDETGFIADGMTRMYSHAFATLFLAEIYGTTGDPQVKARLIRAVNYIASGQNARGAWRYAWKDKESDMSITVCQVMALRAAQNAGIHVRQVYIDQALGYINRVYLDLNDEEGAFKYQEHITSRWSYALTGAGVTALQSAGDYTSPQVRRALVYLDRHIPYTVAQLERGVSLDLRYFYGHYYAALALFHAPDADGARWKRHIQRVSERFVVLQRKPEGYWEDEVGRAYATAMACLILQIPKRLLPIFQR